MHTLISLAGALLGTLALTGGSEPGGLLESADGNTIIALAAFASLAFGGRWVLRSVDRRVFAWAAPLGVVYAITDLAGLSLASPAADLSAFTPSAWMVVRVAGTAWVATGLIAIALHSADKVRWDAVALRRSNSLSNLFAAMVRTLAGRRAVRGIAIVFGLLVLSRLPYLVMWWPGILGYDSFRSIAFMMDRLGWDAQEPVAHSFLIAVWYSLWHSLGWSATFAIAFASILQMLTNVAALTFMYVRIARWGAGTALWWGLFAWGALVPVLPLASIMVVKDTPFISAFIVFVACLGDVAIGVRDGRRVRWAWWGLLVSGIAVALLRNNGVYVVVLGALVLCFIFRRQWKRVLAAGVGIAVFMGIYSGPIQRSLDIAPGLSTEAWSIPLQQIARISLEHHHEMTSDERDFVNSVFTNYTVDDVGEHYQAGRSDYIKEDARAKWDDRSRVDFLRGWAKLALAYPGTAIEATLANTVGYWAPTAHSWNGYANGSANGVREIWLDFDHEVPEGSLRERLVETDFFAAGGVRIPILGLLMSPGFITWLWLLVCVVLMRRRASPEWAVVVPPAILLLTFLAGPVSGSMRYAIGLYAVLPTAVAVALLAKRLASRDAIRADGLGDRDAAEGSATLATPAHGTSGAEPRPR